MLLRNLVGDLAVSLHLVAPANEYCRNSCISAMMRVKDEEWWIEPSILSIKDLVDEYIIIDQSTMDQTPQIIDRLKSEYGLNIIHIRDFSPDYVAISNKALKLTTCRWILRWDGDYVAKDEMPHVIRNLVESLDPRKYYNIYWPHINFEVDLYHVNAENPLHIEHWLVTKSPGAKFIQIDYYEFLYTPPYHKRIEINKPLSLHLRTVKPPIRLLEWHYWWELRRRHMLGKIELWQYIKQRIKDDFGIDDVYEAARIFYEKLKRRKDLARYDKSIWGDYPKILKDYVKRRFGINL